jgi:parallel beta-helix repeat protein
MKQFLTAFLLLCLLQAHATTYYFSSSGGNDANAGTITAPFQTLTKLNSLFPSLKAGDQVLLKRGDIFQGQMIIGASGTSGAPITVGAYGTGAKPVLSGLATLGGWTSLGNGIWESAANPSLRATLSVLLINDTIKAMGRYPNDDAPNKGYLTYQGGSTSSLTTNAIGTAPSFVGGEIAVRINRFYTDRCAVTSQTTNTVGYTPQSGSSPTGGFGFFFQNHPATLDKFGEWYYNPATKKVRVVLGGTTAPYSVKAAITDTLVKAVNRSYVTLDNIAFQGANDIAIAVNGGTNFTVQYCDLVYNGRDAITIAATANFKADHNYIDWSNSRGFNGFQSNSGAMFVTNNTIRNTGTFAGMGWKRSKDGVLNAIEVTTNNSVVTGNTVIKAGYIGIRFYGDNTLVQNNYVDTVCFVKDDGGGIYTWNGSNVNHTNMRVLNNIVKNSIGAPAGTNSTNPEGEGIYTDDFANGLLIQNNWVENTRRGIYLHDGSDNTVTGNTLINNFYGLITYWQNRNRNTVNNVFTRNKVYSLSSSELGVYLNYTSAPTTFTIAGWGRIDSNTYCRPAGEALTVANFSTRTTSTSNFTFAQWQSTYSFDLHATRSAGCVVPADTSHATDTTTTGGGTDTTGTGGGGTGGGTTGGTTNKTYYFAANGSDANTGTVAGQPLKSLAKINTLSLQPGDQVLLRKGDIFTGSFLTTQNGTAAAPVTIGAYGSGANPVISGFVPVTTWTSIGGGIYESNALSVSGNVNVLTINGIQYEMGRTPNAGTADQGYYRYESHTATSITDNNVTYGSPYIGATAVIRTTRFSIDYARITGASGGTLTFPQGSVDSMQYAISNNNYGYFITNSPNTLDQFGEWYFDKTTRKLRLYLSGNSPSLYNIQLSGTGVLLEPQNSNMIVRDITFTGVIMAYGITGAVRVICNSSTASSSITAPMACSSPRKQAW